MDLVTDASRVVTDAYRSMREPAYDFRSFCLCSPTLGKLFGLSAARRVKIWTEVVLPVTSESYIAQARTNGRKHGCKTDCPLVGRCVYGGRRTRGRDEEADRP